MGLLLSLLFMCTVNTCAGSLPVSLPVIETEDISGTFYWKRIPLPATNTPEEHAQAAFKYFFRYSSYGVPENVNVLGVSLEDGLLTVDVSREILNYGGGSAFERALTTQLIKIAAEVPGTVRFILTIEGTLQPLAEGTEVILPADPLPLHLHICNLRHKHRRSFYCNLHRRHNNPGHYHMYIILHEVDKS